MTQPQHHRISLQARAIGLSQELRDNLLKAVDATESWRREAAEIRCGEVFKGLSAIMHELAQGDYIDPYAER